MGPSCGDSFYGGRSIGGGGGGSAGDEENRIGARVFLENETGDLTEVEI